MLRFILTVLLLAMSFTVPVQAARHITVNIPEYRLNLIENNKVLKTYIVAVGTQYEQTPTGIYRILSKEEFPTWFPGSKFEDQTPVPYGPDNPLGTRWLEFQPTFGIHGTNKGWDINYPVSGGCIRMHNQDVQELYEYVEVGTPVIISYETMVFEEKPDGLYVAVWPDIYHRGLNTIQHFTSRYAAYQLNYPNGRIPQFPKPGINGEDILPEKIALPAAAAIPSPSTLLPPIPQSTTNKH
jgi:L,D-transpeptidase ErfK/SrfK